MCKCGSKGRRLLSSSTQPCDIDQTTFFFPTARHHLCFSFPSFPCLILLSKKRKRKRKGRRRNAKFDFHSSSTPQQLKRKKKLNEGLSFFIFFSNTAILCCLPPTCNRFFPLFALSIITASYKSTLYEGKTLKDIYTHPFFVLSFYCCFLFWFPQCLFDPLAGLSL